MEDCIDTEFPVVVAGGGIGGLGVALGLARRGFRVQVFEQAPEFREVGAGIQLAPNGMRALHQLGLTSKLKQWTSLPPAIELRDALNGSKFAHLDLGDDFLQYFGHPYAVIHRADLLSTIFSECQAHPNIQLERSTEVVDFSQDNRSVTVQLKDGRQIKGHALVGADGLRSVIRQKIIGDGRNKVSRLVCYRSVVPKSEIPDSLWSPNVVMWSGPDADFVHYPLRCGELYNLVATFMSDQEFDVTDIEGRPDEVWGSFEGHLEEIQHLLRKIDMGRRWLVGGREPIKNWTQGRVTLIGDAAHPMFQYAAQGACQALEDAVCLSESMWQNSDDPETALQSYYSSRYIHTARVQLTAKHLREVAQFGGALADLRAQLFAERWPTQEKAYETLDWLWGKAGSPAITAAVQ
ncbi:FAD-dependent monooxygenase [Pusillimonas noertemannii]|uniref:Salicylate hydroxylase n=1 Tax=Pusillimonas noertemannii TaxID=305977 RepID=A0A2U1CIQ6_9BURK|nr:FAD-dependent monooxygenase [Pusillimonas noertemannii]NYT70749.1 FAD-dependent monooxygenase [Pusillimonas noertemannii]PVY60907.1 salicylate hydroxylase [Pusillimonas noertemannii]TFL08505.1 3-hydroxybenzoate 6-monooxygenase [Pusillimonas noertemannii]